jgi:hypothetical protein
MPRYSLQISMALTPLANMMRTNGGHNRPASEVRLVLSALEHLLKGKAPVPDSALSSGDQLLPLLEHEDFGTTVLNVCALTLS